MKTHKLCVRGSCCPTLLVEKQTINFYTIIDDENGKVSFNQNSTLVILKETANDYHIIAAYNSSMEKAVKLNLDELALLIEQLTKEYQQACYIRFYDDKKQPVTTSIKYINHPQQWGEWGINWQPSLSSVPASICIVDKTTEPQIAPILQTIYQINDGNPLYFSLDLDQLSLDDLPA